jgi:hypothetical protein
VTLRLSAGQSSPTESAPVLQEERAQLFPAGTTWSGTEGFAIHTALQIGKYLVSPLTRRTEGGPVNAAVSIRSGRGSMTHDRVMRFVPVFDTHDQAARFATAQALAWISARAAALCPTPFERTE